ncbi:hypothetical protein [Sporosarcina sp. JAI121]|uniref:hypothetical protein n=1 Tax=Sporosarcina sp. JAI121 TaxID=2723064 RepID=UPI0015CEBB38|nr:hypothetical protein [Sporosarcina sp. JAI121]NYF24412.1 hypothetical protein [Sporosarcina sp. JAI121]
MLKVIGILLVAAVIWRVEVPSLLQKNYKKELVVFLLFLSIGVGLGIVQALGKPIPNPMDFLTFIFNPLNDTFFR